ncbi:retrovirus-related pol polyprotein from transposon TNT 1-94 [Tanacetum coccineum]
MRETLLSSSISRITKSAGKVNLPTSASIFSAIPTGYWNDLSANLTLILLGLRVLRDSFAYKEYGIWLMLAPRSAKALQEKVLLKLHGIRKLPGSLSLGGTLFWIILGIPAKTSIRGSSSSSSLSKLIEIAVVDRLWNYVLLGLVECYLEEIQEVAQIACQQIYTHLKAYEPHAKKTLKKQEQSTSIVDPLAYVAHTTSAPALSLPSTPSPQPTAQSPNDALMATMTQIANLLSGFQKQFPPTNNQLRTSSNSKTHATVHDGQIVTEPIQRKAPGNVGNTGARGKKVICYNCRGEGHVARQCKEPKRKMDSQYFKDKALLMEAKEKGDVLDAEAEAFLADVDCTAPYDQPQALTTTNMFQANHEDAYDSDVDEGPNAAVAFMANLSSTSATNNPVNEVHSNDNQIFDNVDYQIQEMHQEEHLDSDAETEIDDNTIPYHQYLLDTEAQNVPTEVSADTSDKVSMIAI